MAELTPKVVQAPVSLLLHPGLTPSAKVLWLAMCAHTRASASEAGAGIAPNPRRSRLGSRGRRTTPAGGSGISGSPAGEPDDPGSPAGGTNASQTPKIPNRLAPASGLTPPTIRKSLHELEAAGWSVASPNAIPGASVSIPVSLLAERRIRPRAKLLYGLLQTLPGFRGEGGEFGYSSLRASVGISVVTLRQLVQELKASGWIQLRQKDQLAPIRFALRIPDLDRSSAEVAKAERRLEEADFRGEAIMKEYLSLLIDSDEFEENARPGFLINPQTEERMELDRYYPPVVAFEFNGPQHYRTTIRFPSHQALAMLQARDLMKEALCARRGVRVVVVTAADLNLAAMQAKVGTLLPLRDLTGHEELIRFLDKVGRSYQE